MKDMKKPGVLINKGKISKKIAQLAKKISKDYKDKDLMLICVLKGATVFLSELLLNISIPVSIDFVQVSSYGNNKTSGALKFIKDITLPVKDTHVLLVDDIADTGRTLNELIKVLKRKKAKTINVCTLLDKPSRRIVKVPLKYTGFKVPDKFVVGFGIDYAEKFRNLPYIGVIK
jgi:hypoxanthine phosphoribosyltransferase